MQETENYGLKKPEETDFYDVNDFNDNMDIIDKKIAECFQRGNEFKENLVSNLIALGFEADTSQSMDELFSKLETVKKGSGTAQPKHVLAGQTFTNDDGVEYEGTMPDRRGITVDAIAVNQDDTYTYFKTPEGGYDEGSMVRTKNSNLINIDLLQTYSHSGSSSQTYTFDKDVKNCLVLFSAMNSTSDVNWYVGKNTVTSSSATGSIAKIEEGEANYNTYRTCLSLFKLSNFKKGDAITIGNANTCRIAILQIN